MTRWVRFQGATGAAFGTLEGDTIAIHSGDMYASPVATGETVALADVALLPPSQPTKIIALWNNFHQLAAKLGVAEPSEPLYLLKANSTVAAPGAEVARPASYTGKIVYEGELGIVIGKPCNHASEEEAAEAIFGYTIVNDLTLADIIQKDPTFPQWARAKGFDSSCPFGPAIATGLDPASLTVRTLLDGVERQNYPLADMIFPPARLVSLLSRDMTLLPGDLIACGTSLGVGSIKAERSVIAVTIDGIGTLTNTLVQ